MLELRGDTVPADEQPAIPVHQSGMVTHDSPTADKLALYTDLFRARRVRAPLGEPSDWAAGLVTRHRGRLGQARRQEAPATCL